MRLFRMSAAVLAILCCLSSCSSQKTRVEREAKIRTRLEAYDSFVDKDSVLQFDSLNGRRLYRWHCASCHGEDGMHMVPGKNRDFPGLRISAIRDPKRFFGIASYGQKHLGMPAFGEEIGMQDLIDITGYCMHLPEKR